MPVSASPRNVMIAPEGRPPSDSSNAEIPLFTFMLVTSGVVSVVSAGFLRRDLLGQRLEHVLEPLVPLPRPPRILELRSSRLLRRQHQRRLRRCLRGLWRRLCLLTLRTPIGPLISTPS